VTKSSTGLMTKTTTHLTSFSAIYKVACNEVKPKQLQASLRSTTKHSQMCSLTRMKVYRMHQNQLPRERRERCVRPPSTTRTQGLTRLTQPNFFTPTKVPMLSSSTTTRCKRRPPMDFKNERSEFENRLRNGA